MSENNFEKSVQREMEGFKLKPSEEVWTKVEERIREKKKRRIFFILFFLLGFALLGYWQKDLLFDQEIKETGQIEKNDSTDEIKKNNSTINEVSAIKNKADERIHIETVKESTKDEKIKNVLPAEKTFSQNQPDKKENVVVNEKAIEKQEEVKTILPEKKEQAVLIPEPEIKKETINPIGEKENVSQKTNIEPVVIKPELQQKEEAKKEVEILQIKNDSSNAVTQIKTSHKKWKWGFLFTPGISTLDDGVLSLSTKKSYELLAGPITSAGSIQNRPAPPSGTNAGFAFQAGTFLKNQFKTRSSFSIGLQYAYYSEHVSVGARKDTVLRYASQLSSMADANFAYAAGGAKEDFTNKYHFIELPAIFQFQLNKKKTSPFNWSIGLSIGQLISAKSLAYDTSFGGIYYDNKKNLHKTQFSLTTGFSWGIFNDKKISGSLGPVVDLHFNSLMNNELDKNKHLIFAGLKSTINFSNK